MLSKLFRALRWMGHACFEFGDYFMSFHRRCFKSGRCEGNPTHEDARRDFRQMLRSRYTTFSP